MKALVTGGAGFIGSHIVDSLINMGWDVVVVDNLATGAEQNINGKARFYRISINDVGLRDIFLQEKPDIVFHEAAQTVVGKSVADPVFDARVNILGSLNVMMNCLNAGVKKIIYASSCAIYGEPQYLPIDEKHPVNPISQYGASKHTVEHYLCLNHALYGLEYVVLRYANVYGPRQNNESGVVAIFSAKMLAREAVKIFGDGDNTRDYVYVGDIVRANILAMAPGKTGIYNIGTGKETCDQEVFDVTSREFASRMPAQYSSRRPAEIKHMCLDCTRATRELGWRPEVSFDDGVARTAAHYRSRQPVLG
ncbi:MAG: NAD-dependent epimerase/dehydratase family protein [Chloroflexota bacterium]